MSETANTESAGQTSDQHPAQSSEQANESATDDKPHSPDEDDKIIELRPNEELTGEPLARTEISRETMRVDRKTGGFPLSTSFHSSYDTIIRREIEIIIKERHIRVETLTDIHSGKSVRADLSALGPARSKITWAGISLLICLGIEAALPFDRLQKVLFSGLAIFSTSSICRYFKLAARKLLPIYLYLITELAAKASVIYGDDSPTRTLEMEAEARNGFPKSDGERDDMALQIEEKLGRVFPSKSKPNRPKESLFISHVHGRTDPGDPCSTIYIFRTHFGSVGNLISKMLVTRAESAPKVTLQGDLSPSNFPDPPVMERWVAGFVGCSAHARRPVYRAREDDPDLCERMLELFALLGAVEKQIDRDGRTANRTVAYRQSLAAPVWDKINKLAQSVVDAEAQAVANPTGHRLWPKKSPLYKGCRYIVKHYKKLTAYLSDYRLEANNNRAERLLRGEKMLLVSAKFRKSEVGRVSLDILRSLVMTARAASVSPYAYLCWALSQKNEEINENPHLFTPLAFKRLHQAAVDSKATGT
jgi:hypothetical protein